MPIKWCHNSKTGEVFSYTEAEGITDFPRGVLLAYGDYVTTGFRNKEEALTWAQEWGPCHTCKATHPVGVCRWCGGEIVAQPVIL